MPAPPWGANPFDSAGVEPDENGVRRYTNLHDSIVAMLRDTVDATPRAEALVEIGGERIHYRQLWDRASRVAGGLRAAPAAESERQGAEGPATRYRLRLAALLTGAGHVVPSARAGAVP